MTNAECRMMKDECRTMKDRLSTNPPDQAPWRKILVQPLSTLARRLSFYIHPSSFILHSSSRIVHHSSFVIRHSSFIVHHSSFIILHSPFLIPFFALLFFLVWGAAFGQAVPVEVKVTRSDDGKTTRVKLSVRPVKPDIALPSLPSSPSVAPPRKSNPKGAALENLIQEEVRKGRQTVRDTTTTLQPVAPPVRPAAPAPPVFPAVKPATPPLPPVPPVIETASQPEPKPVLPIPALPPPAPQADRQGATTKTLESPVLPPPAPQADRQGATTKTLESPVLPPPAPQAEAKPVPALPVEEKALAPIPEPGTAPQDEAPITSLTVLAQRYQHLGKPVAADALTTESSRLETMVRNRMERAQAKIKRGRDAEAQRELIQLATDFPDSRVAPEALFLAAQLEKANANKRIRSFYIVALRYPHTPQGVQSFLEIGDTRLLLGDFEGALDALSAYRIRGGTDAEKPPLRMKTIHCLLQLRRYEETLKELASLEADFPSSRLTEKVLDFKSECQMALDRPGEALLSLRDLLERYPNYAQAPKAMLAMGLCYEEIKQPQAAQEKYKQILQIYPPDRPDAPFETLAADQRLKILNQTLFPRREPLPPFVIPAPVPQDAPTTPTQIVPALPPGISLEALLPRPGQPKE
jgi:tetratricopeptide (TPR) repeat protein